MRYIQAAALLLTATMLGGPAIAATPENGGPYDARFHGGWHRHQP